MIVSQETVEGSSWPSFSLFVCGYHRRRGCQIQIADSFCIYSQCYTGTTLPLSLSLVLSCLLLTGKLKHVYHERWESSYSISHSTCNLIERSVVDVSSAEKHELWWQMMTDVSDKAARAKTRQTSSRRLSVNGQCICLCHSLVEQKLFVAADLTINQNIYLFACFLCLLNTRSFSCFLRNVSM